MPETITSFERVSRFRGDYSSSELYKNFDSVLHDSEVWVLKVTDSLSSTRAEPVEGSTIWVKAAASLVDSFVIGNKMYFNDGTGGLSTIDIGAEGTAFGINSANANAFVEPSSARHNGEYTLTQSNRYVYASYSYVYFRTANKTIIAVDLDDVTADTHGLGPVDSNFSALMSYESVVIEPEGSDVGGTNPNTVVVEGMYESNGMQFFTSGTNKGYGLAKPKGLDDADRFGLGLDDYTDYAKNRRNWLYTAPFNSIYWQASDSSNEITNVNTITVRTIVGCPMPYMTPGQFGTETAFNNHLNRYSLVAVIHSAPSVPLQDGQLFTMGNQFLTPMRNNSFYTADSSINGLLSYDGVVGATDFFWSGSARSGYALTATGVTYVGTNEVGEAGNGMGSGGVTNNQYIMTGTDFNNIISIASIGSNFNPIWVGTFFLKDDGTIFRVGVLPHGVEATRDASLVTTPTVIALPNGHLGAEIVSNYGAGTSSFVAVRATTGEVYMLGDFPADDVDNPGAFVALNLPTGKTVRKMVAGDKQLFLIMTDGTVYITGHIYDNPNSGTAHEDNRFCLIEASDLRPSNPTLIANLPEPIDDITFYVRGYDATGLHIRYRLILYGNSGKVYYCDSDHKRIRQVLL